MVYWYLLLIMVLLLLYLYIQNNVLSTSTYKIAVPKMHPNLKGKKILFLSDTHFRDRNSHNFYEHLINKTETIKPDLILFGGDIIHASANGMAIKHAKDFFFRIGQLAPTYVVFGNHDMRNKYVKDIRRMLQMAGVRLLDNEATWVSFGKTGVGFWLMGLNEYQTSLDIKKEALERISLPKRSKNEPKILIAHYPHYFEKYLTNDNKRPNLVLSGHVHGGQVRLPIIGGLFAPGQGFNPRYDYGLFKSEKYPMSRLILTRGIGNSTFPFRINNRPELVIIKID